MTAQIDPLASPIDNTDEVKQLALIGAGNIGRRHLKAITEVAQAGLAAIVDTDPRVERLAADMGVPFFSEAGAMLSRRPPDGVIVGTPTECHFQPVLDSLQAGAHVLVEKPITTTMDEARTVIEMSERCSRHVLVGHHRRYYETVHKARELVQGGAIGQLLGVCGQWTVKKAEAYFEPGWRRQRASGPVMTNLIHELDTLRYVCGEIESLIARTGRGIRGHAKEETAAILLNFESGAVGTFLLSDAASSPWAWEHATGENAAFPHYAQNVVRFVGSQAALEFPNLVLWQHDGGEPDWNHHLAEQPVDTQLGDAYVAQCCHFCGVISGREQPRITASDAARSLAAVLAVFDAAGSETEVKL